MTTKQFSLSSGNVIQVSQHKKTEIPCFYPEKIVRLKNGTVGLVNPHSMYYMPTQKNQQKLEKITKHAPQWFYINYLSRSRTR